MRLPQSARLSRLRRLLAGRVQRHHRLTVGFLVLVAVSLIGLEVALLGPRTPALSEPTGSSRTFAATWTLAELTQHADAGEVAVVGLPKPGSDSSAPASLVAQTRDGRLVPVPL